MARPQLPQGLRNPTAAGAVAGTPGTMPGFWTSPVSHAGLQRAVQGHGSDKRGGFVDLRFAGTSTAGVTYDVMLDAKNAVPAVAGQSWEFDAQLALVAGSMAGFSASLILFHYTAAGSNLGHVFGTNLSALPPLADERFRLAATFTNPLTAFVMPAVYMYAGTGLVLDATIRIQAPSLCRLA